MKKRLLTLEDLYNYYSSNTRSSHFSSKDEGKNVVVQIPATMSFDASSDTDGLTAVRLQACHTLKNLNKSFISEDVALNAMNSFKNRPILGRLHEVDGQWEFGSHDMHIDDNGEVIYDEVPVGIIPESSNPHFEYDEEKEHNYVVVDGYIFDDYSKAKDVLERDGEASCSVELNIRSMSYNAKDKVLNIEDYFYSGVTILGKTDNGDVVRPGMEGANIKLADFKSDKNSIFSQEEIIERISDLEKKFADFSIDKNQGKEEIQLENEIENVEVLEQEESVCTEFEEAVDETVETPDVVEEEEEKFSKTFELSHEDIRVALYALIASAEETDNEWYAITNVYDDHFVYEGLFCGNIWGQKYAMDGDNVGLVEDRYALHKELLTDSEYAILNEMRSNYDAIKSDLGEVSEKLAKYEAEPEKMEVLNSEDYSLIANTDEFVALREQDAHFDLSVDEVKEKANELLLSYAKTQRANTEGSVSVSNKKFVQGGKPEKRSRYGNLFSEKN